MKKSLGEYLQERYSKGTAYHYEREIRIYQSHNPKASEASYQDILHYLGTLRKRYPNPKTLNRLRCCIKAYYDYLWYTGKRKDNPAGHLYLKDQVNRDVQLQDLFTAAELESLLKKEERFKSLRSRNEVLMSLLIYQGLQVGELSNVELEDINLRLATIYIKSSLKSNSRTLSLRPTQIVMFQDYLNEGRVDLLKGKSHSFFLLDKKGSKMQGQRTVNQLLSHFKDVYAPGKLTATAIRQSVITNLLKAGNDLRVVQVFAGHKYPSTTERYKPTNEGELQTAIERYHPLR